MNLFRGTCIVEGFCSADLKFKRIRTDSDKCKESVCHKTRTDISGAAGVNRKDKTAVFDLIPVLYLLKPEIFTSKEGKIDVILDGEDTQGQTLFEEGEGNHKVLLDTDREACMKIFFEAIDSLDQKYR